MSDKVKKGRGFAYVKLSSGFSRSKPRSWRKVVLTAFGLALTVVALLVIAAIAIGLGTTLSHAHHRCRLESSERFNCLPDEANASKETCRRLGCCWDDSKAPFCFHSSESGYAVEEPFQYTADDSIRGCLSRKGELTSQFGASLERLCVNITFEVEDRLHIKVYDPSVARYEVPMAVPVPSTKFQRSMAKYKVELVNETFSFSVLRCKDNKTTIFRLAPGFIFADQFIQLSAYLPTSNIYGLGEHMTSLRLPTDDVIFTIFAADIFPNPDVPAQNLYGVHPFYLGLEEDGSAHGVLFLNSNAMEVALQSKPSITYRTIGGIVDLYFFLGPSPEQVIQQYTEVVGRPFFPPYWSLGFHLCRWGYDSANNTWDVVKKMRELEVPQDVQWSDIDYMHNHLDFSYDHESFAELPDMIDDIHQHGQKFIVITDPGISNHEPNGSYEPYNSGLEMNVFIKNSSGGLLVGRVWPDLTVYPDFFHPNISLYWEQQIQRFHDNVSFDGLWIDMNEPSNFVNGSVDGCSNTSLDQPPYLPGTIKVSSIAHKTLCMSAQQHSSSHYNLHSLYGHSEAKATMNALENILGQRSIVISRSTFVGSGRYTGHWLGDNASQWKHMTQSIPGILHFSLFGIPLVGADICGFFDHPTEELCLRWQQLGAFYPFSRNHNIKGTLAQDPTVWSPRAIDAIRDALLFRYHLLPYLYTLFYLAHVKGSTVARPLFFEFPKDSQTWALETQFMWGSTLLISPVLEENVTSIDIYLPPSARWYSINSSLHNSGGEVKNTGHVTIPVSLSSIPVYMRGGSIIPVQRPNTTTYKSRQNPFSIIVALDKSGQASGQLFADDGHSLSGPQDGTLLTFSFEQRKLVNHIQQASSKSMVFDHLNTELEQVYILGLVRPPSSNATLNHTVPLDYTWNSSLKVLMISLSGKGQQITSPFSIAWEDTA